MIGDIYELDDGSKAVAIQSSRVMVYEAGDRWQKAERLELDRVRDHVHHVTSSSGSNSYEEKCLLDAGMIDEVISAIRYDLNKRIQEDGYAWVMVEYGPNR